MFCRGTTNLAVRNQIQQATSRHSELYASGSCCMLGTLTRAVNDGKIEQQHDSHLQMSISRI